MRLLTDDDLRWVAGGYCTHPGQYYSNTEIYEAEQAKNAAATEWLQATAHRGAAAQNYASVMMNYTHPMYATYANEYIAAEAEFQAAADALHDAQEEYSERQAAKCPQDHA